MKSSMTCDDKINLLSTTINEIIEDMRAQKAEMCQVFEKSSLCKVTAKSAIWRAFDSIESYLDAQYLKINRNRAIVGNAFILIMMAINTISVISCMQIIGITPSHLARVLKSYIC